MYSLRPMQLEFEVFPDHNKHCRLSFNEHWAHVKIFNIAISKTCFWKSNIFYLNKCWLICSYISDDIQADGSGGVMYRNEGAPRAPGVQKYINLLWVFLNGWTNTIFCSYQGTVPKHAPQSREYLKRICRSAHKPQIISIFMFETQLKIIHGTKSVFFDLLFILLLKIQMTLEKASIFKPNII